MTILSDPPKLAPAELDSYWMPFTANRQFKAAPRLFVAAEGMYYTTRMADASSTARWTLVLQRRHCVSPSWSDPEASGDDGLRAGVSDGESASLRSRHRIVDLALASSTTLVFCNSGPRRWTRAQDRDRVAPCARRGRAHALVCARGAAIRRGLRRHLGGRLPATARCSGRCSQGSITCPNTTTGENAYAHGQPEWRQLADDSSGSWRCTTLRRSPQSSSAPRRIYRRAHPAQGLPAAPARRLRRSTHPAHLRRGDHGLRAPRREFGADVYGVEPDMIAFAKGVTSAPCRWAGHRLVRPIRLSWRDAGPRSSSSTVHLSANPLACAGGIAARLQGRGSSRAPSACAELENALHS